MIYIVLNDLDTVTTENKISILTLSSGMFKSIAQVNINFGIEYGPVRKSHMFFDLSLSV